jgi:hypothetical protein
MTVIAHDPYASEDKARAQGVQLVSFDDALARVREDEAWPWAGVGMVDTQACGDAQGGLFVGARQAGIGNR